MSFTCTLYQVSNSIECRRISLRRVESLSGMENSYATYNGDGQVMMQSPYQQCVKGSLPWLDLRVFYVRLSKCEIDDSTPECLALNHIPLHPDTLVELNGVRTSIYVDGISTLLRRDRLDKKSEEAIFVSTDSIRMTGSVKFEVFDKDMLVLSGVLELCSGNGYTRDSRNHDHRWSMDCESDIIAGTGFLEAKRFMGSDSALPTVEVCVAGTFSGTPLILTKTLLLSSLKKQTRRGMLDSIPEYEATEESRKDFPSDLPLQISDYSNHKPESEDYNNLYSGTEFIEGEDEQLSWFNAGLRVGVGIGLSLCLGIGIGVGMVVRTYQGTTRSLRRRLL